MNHVKFIASVTTAITSSGYALFETIIKSSTTLLGFAAAVLGFAAGYYALRVKRKEDAIKDIELRIAQKKEQELSK